jgi:hypothetical protein
MSATGARALKPRNDTVTRQGLEDERQHLHADAGDGPGDQRPQAAGRPPERRGNGKDAFADHRDRAISARRESFCSADEVTPAFYGP